MNKNTLLRNCEIIGIISMLSFHYFGHLHDKKLSKRKAKVYT